MTTLIATSVVRGSQQGQSHGGVYLLNLATQQVVQVLDWNTLDIDWQGRGGDRGLRGIAFDEETVYIAASDELFAYNPDFSLRGSWKNAYLKHCHEISIHSGQVFLTSTGCDSILAFDMAQEKFHWGLHIDTDGFRFSGSVFDPLGEDGPLMLNKLHLNSVFSDDKGLFMAGMKSGGMLVFNGKRVSMRATLPAGTHNAQPYADGVLFNDTSADALRFASPDSDRDRAFKMPVFPADQLESVGVDTSRLARPGFGRGLCVIREGLIAAGSSPSTVSVYDLDANKRVMSVNLSKDVRNAIHGLEVWRYA